jgi:hypothetical protein
MGKALDLDRDVELYGHVPDTDLDDELLTPFNAAVRGSAPGRVVETHRERSAKAKRWDRRQQAPVTTDVETWVEHPDQYDYLGVDTLAADVRARRADRLAEERLDVPIRERDLDGGTRGRARIGKLPNSLSPKYVEVDRDVAEGREDDPRFQRPEVVAHEAGHVLDAVADDDTDYYASTYELRGERREQARRLSTMVRGPFREGSDYRDTSKELAADAVAAATVAPRAARREAPDLVEWIEDRLGLSFRR